MVVGDEGCIVGVGRRDMLRWCIVGVDRKEFILGVVGGGLL